MVTFTDKEIVQGIGYWTAEFRKAWRTYRRRRSFAWSDSHRRKWIRHCIKCLRDWRSR